MAYTLDKNINMKGRENSAGGLIVYLAEFDNVASFTLSTDGTYISGITMVSGATFHSYAMPRENINFTNGTEINVSYGNYIYKPLLNFIIPGLQPDQLQMFETLVHKTVIAIVKTNEEKYFVIGRTSGLDITSNSNYQLGQAASDLIGSTIELDGLEKHRIIEIDPSIATTLMSTIVSAI